MWTDKYQPSSSAEVIGNSGSVKKLKSWLSEWKHVLDREAKKARKQLMKKNKGKLQKTEGIVLTLNIWTDFHNGLFTMQPGLCRKLIGLDKQKISE